MKKVIGGAAGAVLTVAGWLGYTVYNSPKGGKLRIVTTDLPQAVCGQPYRATIQVKGGVKPYTWTVTEGAVPTWLALTPQDDGLLLSGTPPLPGPDGTCGGPYQIAGLSLRTRAAQ